MKKFALSSVMFIFVALLLATVFIPTEAQAAPNDKACWGQATKVFAKTGEMGKHASEQPTPRAGLRNLARKLAKDGVIPDDSMQALGAFVATSLTDENGDPLTIDACM